MTTLPPHALLEACLSIEARLGRVRERRWGPRAIDIDVLHYAGATVSDERLVLPHRFLRERAFVLVPLAEIAPDLVTGGETVSEALARSTAAGSSRSRRGLEHFPTKWKPVRRRKCDKTKS